MKKMTVIVGMLFVVALVIGLDCRQTYIDIDITDKEQLARYEVTVGYSSADEFEEEEESEWANEDTPQDTSEDMIDDMTEENIAGEDGTEEDSVQMSQEELQAGIEAGYLNEEGQYIDEEGNVIGNIIGEEDEAFFDEILAEYEEQHEKELENMNGSEYDITYSDFKYLDMNTEDGMRAVLNDAQYVIIATATGQARALGETLQQEVKVKKVVKGDVDWVDKKIKTISTSCPVGFYKEGKSMHGNVNLMQEGKEYLIFLNWMNQKPEKYETMAYLADCFGVPYFCLDEMETKVAPIDDEGTMLYEDVKDYEFFVSDDIALQELLQLKEECLEKYVE